MKTVMCRVCNKFFKKRRVGRTLEWCQVCRQLCCTAHITTVVHAGSQRNAYGLRREDHIRTCKLCLAEKALVSA